MSAHNKAPHVQTTESIRTVCAHLKSGGVLDNEIFDSYYRYICKAFGDWKSEHDLVLKY